MITEKKEEIISAYTVPAQTKMNYEYIAEDGNRFSVKSECIAYEKELNNQKTKKELNFKYFKSELTVNNPEHIILVCTLKDKNDITKLYNLMLPNFDGYQDINDIREDNFIPNQKYIVYSTWDSLNGDSYNYWNVMLASKFYNEYISFCKELKNIIFGDNK